MNKYWLDQIISLNSDEIQTITYRMEKAFRHGTVKTPIFALKLELINPQKQVSTSMKSVSVPYH